MYRTQSSAAAPGSIRQSKASLKPSRRSIISRGPSVQVSRQQPEQPPVITDQQQQQRHQSTMTILQKRERMRVLNDDGEDVTPKTLIHPEYSSTRRTAFDAIAALASSATALAGPGAATNLAHHQQQQQQQQQHDRPSLVTVSSFSSIYTLDEILAAKGGQHSDSLMSSSARASLRGSLKNLPYQPTAKKTQDVDYGSIDSDAPSQYHLSRIESQEPMKPEERVTLTIRETETFFLFEMAQLTEDATTEIGEALIAANERYDKLRAGAGRKCLDAESQTPQVYTKSRATYVARQERKNHATYVNNWVMHDDYEDDERASRAADDRPPGKDLEKCTKFADERDKPTKSLSATTDGDPAVAIVERRADGCEDATRVALRILASRDYELAQKRFAGLVRQDPCDPNLQLVYGMELLWRHEDAARTRGKAVATFRWNPVNGSLLAVGYETRNSRSRREGAASSRGSVLIWCAKNPTEPDRHYEFDSSVSDLDWSKQRPNLLAVGFYDGTVRVIDVSSAQLTVAWQTDDRATLSYEPHWQVQWWSMDDDENCLEQLYTSNQDGRVCRYPPNEEFAAREIFRCQRVEAKIAGVPRLARCLGNSVPLSRHPGALLLRRWPGRSSVYLVASEEGCVHKCSTAQPHAQIDAAFLAHDGACYSLEFSPFCDRLILTCGADWHARIWAEGLGEPLLKFSTKMACVNSAAWSPRNSTIFAYAVENEICIWDLRRKSYRPASVTTVAGPKATIVKLEFTRSGEQLVAADDEGVVYVYGLEGMPLPPLDQSRTLVEALLQALVTKPELSKKLQKLGAPFDIA